MKARRILCWIVAVVLMLAMTISASAANKANTVVTATCKLPTIRVSVPTSNKVVVNPQKLPVNLSATIQVDEYSDAPQIISAPSYICNESEVPVEVNVSVTGKVSSGSYITFAKESTAASTSKNKNVFMFFQMKAVDEIDSLEDMSWDSVYDEDSHVLVSTTAKTKNAIVRLDANKEDDCYGVFKLYGDCVEEPTKPWKATDKLSVTVAFTFTPLPLDD